MPMCQGPPAYHQPPYTMPSVKDVTETLQGYEINHGVYLPPYSYAQSQVPYSADDHDSGHSGVDYSASSGVNINTGYSSHFANSGGSQRDLHNPYVVLDSHSLSVPSSYNECEPNSTSNNYYFEHLSSSQSAGKLNRKRRAPTIAQRRAANVRERKRMYNLNESFDCLRQHIPTFAYEKRLSRIETLRLAMSYISFMSHIVKGQDPSSVRFGLYDNYDSHNYTLTSVNNENNGILTPGYNGDINCVDKCME